MVIAVFVTLSTLLLVVGCPPPTVPGSGDGSPMDPADGSPAAGDVPSFFWGRWVRMDGVNEQWYIADRGVSVDGRSRETTVVDGAALTVAGETVSRRTENMITVTPGDGLEYYLFRQSGASASIVAGVRGSTAAPRGLLSGLSGIRTIIRNINNTSNTVETSTDAEGTAAFDTVIPGDEYELEIPEQDGVEEAVVVTVVPEFDGENVGFVTLNNADQNFKVGYSVPDMDGGYMYAERSYTLIIRVTNHGSADMLSADYEVTPPEGVSLTGAGLKDILGTIQADGGVRELQFALYADSFDATFRDFLIPVRITSLDGDYAWEDGITVRVFREAGTLVIRANQNDVQGIVISPDNTSTAFVTQDGTKQISVPIRENPYMLALSGANYNSETKYAVGLNRTPVGDGSSLTSATINEPNNDETQATPAYLESEYLGYLGVYDLDFFRLHYTLQSEQPVGWTNVQPSSMAVVTNTHPTFTWDPVTGSSGYDLQVADTLEGVLTAEVIYVDEHTYTPAEALENNAPHHWRVRAKAPDGQYSAWSTTYSFVMGWGAIAEMSPANGSTVADTTPTLSWTDVEGAEGYELRYGATAAATETAVPVSVGAANYDYPTALGNGDELHWQVRANDEHGRYGMWSSVATLTAKTEWAIGHAGLAGGVVFYDKGSYSDGWRYLEAAPVDQHTSIGWGGYGIAVGGTGTEIGTGAANSEAIVAKLGSGSYAARICYDLELGGYDDWFLPSKDELNQLRARRFEVGGFAPGQYWSSSEVDKRYAWNQAFDSGDQGAGWKGSLRVRAVRGF